MADTAAASNATTIEQALNAATNVIVDFAGQQFPHVRISAVYAVFLLWTYLFHSPFRVRNRASNNNRYIYMSKIVNAWAMIHIVVFHVMPTYLDHFGFSDGALQPAALFFPLFAAFTLVLAAYHRAKRAWGLHITYATTFLMLILNSLVLALICTVHYTHCDVLFHSDVDRFLPIDFTAALLCPKRSADEKPWVTILTLVFGGCIIVLLDYQWKRWFGFESRTKGVMWCDAVRAKNWSESGKKADGEEQQQETAASADRRKMAFAINGESNYEPNTQPDEPEGHEMVPWYSLVAAHTGIRVFIGSKLTFGRFDYRSMESDHAGKVFRITDDHAAAEAAGEDSAGGFWFDWVADVGDGFNSTYCVARMMAQPELAVQLGDEQPHFTAKILKKTRRLVSSKARAAFNRLPSFRDIAEATGGRLGGGGGGESAGKSPNPAPTRRQAASPDRGMGRRARSADDVYIGLAARRRGSAADDGDDNDGSDYASCTELTLPRGRFLVMGGDMAYPMADIDTYRERFFQVYNDALQYPPQGGKLASKRIRSVSPADGHFDETTIKTTATSHPLLFAIPGNHDWVDGLETYRSTILSFDHLGGWKTPQSTSYYVLALPGDWWMLCTDTGLNADIDQLQMQYFLKFIEEKLRPASSVIVINHDPSWIIDAYERPNGGYHCQPRLTTVARACGARCRMRLAGDTHNYSRYQATEGPLPDVAAAGLGGSTVEGTANVDNFHCPQLVVSGGGGAFLHGTQFPGKRFIDHDGIAHARKATFPPPMKHFGLSWIMHFRLVNWKFDVLGVALYFLLVYSLLPAHLRLPAPTRAQYGGGAGGADDELQALGLSSRHFVLFFSDVFATSFQLLHQWLTDSYLSVSVGAAVILITVGIVEERLPLVRRLLIGATHGVSHILSSVILVAIMTVALSHFVAYGVVHSTAHKWEPFTVRALGGWYRQGLALCGGGCTAFHAEYLEASAAARAAELFVGCFDVLESTAYLHQRLTSPDVVATRAEFWLYYAHFLWFFVLCAAPTVSFVLGAYLCTCVSYLDSSWDLTCSALQIEDGKHFMRFHLNDFDNTLAVHVIGIDTVPTEWERDAAHDAEVKSGLPFHRMKFPSLWRPRWLGKKEPEASRPRLVDLFKVTPTPVSGQARYRRGAHTPQASPPATPHDTPSKTPRKVHRKSVVA
jgi:hypothetical protein